MKTKITLLLLLTLAVFGNYSLINVEYQYRDKLVGHSFDVLRIDPRFGIEIVVNEYELQEVEGLRIPFTVEIDDMELFYRERLEEDSHIRSMFSMGGYRTNSETIEFLDSLHLAAPHLVTEKVSIGRTHEGNDIWMVKITNDAYPAEHKPQIFLDGLLHAREVITHELLIYYMRWLVQNYGSDPLATYIVNHRETFFVPVVNPDGFLWNEATNPHGGGMWRKNRRNNGDGSFGVDLNRNFGYEWAYDDHGSSPNPRAETYRGPGPFSEPESQAYRDLANANEFVTNLSFHSFAGMYLHPWGYDNRAHNPDEAIFDAMGTQLGKYNGYPHGADLLYEANGGTFDWMYGEQVTKPKIFSFIPEVGFSSDGFWPPRDRIMPLILSQQWPCIYMCLAAGSAPMYERFILSDSTGNNNGFADPGEYVRIHISVNNAGVEDAEDVYALCNPIWGISTAPEDSIYIGSIASFTIADSEAGFKIKIDSSLALDDVCTLEVIIRDADGYFLADTIEITIGTPYVIAFYDFEEPSGFTANNDWERGIPRHGLTSAFSGEMVVGTKLRSDYSNNTLSTMQTHIFELPSYLEVARLSFWHWYSTEAEGDILYDGGNVQISVGGGDFYVIDPIGGYDGVFVDHSRLAGEGCFAGSSGGWKRCVIDLTAHIGHEVQFRFRFCSDPFVSGPGWFIDDFMVYGYMPSAVEEKIAVPKDFKLEAYPNPFNSSVKIVGGEGVEIEIYDVRGNLVQTMRGDGLWQPSDNINSGMYLIRAEKEGVVSEAKVLYIK